MREPNKARESLKKVFGHMEKKFTQKPPRTAAILIQKKSDLAVGGSFGVA